LTAWWIFSAFLWMLIGQYKKGSRKKKKMSIKVILSLFSLLYLLCDVGEVHGFMRTMGKLSWSRKVLKSKYYHFDEQNSKEAQIKHAHAEMNQQKLSIEVRVGLRVVVQTYAYACLFSVSFSNHYL
jgi:hypothetical protein